MVLTSVLFFLTAMRAVAQGNGCTEAGGNWYCNQISSIMYNNVGINGTYQRVTDMNGCETTPQAYGGSLAPFNEEVMNTNSPIPWSEINPYPRSP